MFGQNTVNLQNRSGNPGLKIFKNKKDENRKNLYFAKG